MLEPYICKTSFCLIVDEDNGDQSDVCVPAHILVVELGGGRAVKISVEQCSLLDNSANAAVNAANTGMRGGGGIDGAFHKKAGPKLLEALEKAAPSGCETGEVIVTPGFDTQFEYIFHTPGPQWKGGNWDENELLTNCYWNCMNEANLRKLRSIGFCSISTGIYGYPFPDASETAMKAVLKYIDTAVDEVGAFDVKEIVFSMYTEAEYEAYCWALQNIALPWAKRRMAPKEIPAFNANVFQTRWKSFQQKWGNFWLEMSRTWK